MPDTLAALDAPASQAEASILDEIRAGLAASQKTLPAKLFYDAAGCALFNRITQLPEYYVTRAEMALLAAHAADIMSSTPEDVVLVEYGAADESKSLPLIEAAGRISTYVPIDIAPSALEALAGRMRHAHPQLELVPIVADFLRPIVLPEPLRQKPRLGYFPGSTIGNFEPDTALRFLRLARDTLASPERETQFIVGIDLRKDESVLLPAYDDAQGITAAFNRNILRHVNALAGGDLDPDAFAHEARWNPEAGRIEMHLRSLHDQVAQVAGARVLFLAGETIHTENSYKHNAGGFAALASRAGWRTSVSWTDPAGQFGMFRLVC